MFVIRLVLSDDIDICVTWRMRRVSVQPAPGSLGQHGGTSGGLSAVRGTVHGAVNSAVGGT